MKSGNRRWISLRLRGIMIGREARDQSRGLSHTEAGGAWKAALDKYTERRGQGRLPPSSPPSPAARWAACERCLFLSPVLVQTTRPSGAEK
ncbi:hypothetical protein L226DRAFT_11767 [Lentinus tigrinus ALCF2SS1-7]|uniref:uncharacterized protein n=1 Tax=Lentinus tigrinus ALCF2SS1-7 TaxID=1328758 RepID=UPI001166097A|nr:hypothetical protein L226DRAFT_11767 [Lentinus tigrinus ALCF2SS1-7]